MKKITFNDKYGLTQAVLEGRKTQSRKIMSLYDSKNDCDWTRPINDATKQKLIEKIANYKVGEVLAVSQCYGDIVNAEDVNLVVSKLGANKKGIGNKMCVKAELMPHRVRITDIRVERLQDITDGDCEKEGIGYVGGYGDSYYLGHGVKTATGWEKLGNSYKEAYSALIDKVVGKGTWEKNPYVFVYEFELVK